MPYVSPRTVQVQTIQHQDIVRKDSDDEVRQPSFDNSTSSLRFNFIGGVSIPRTYIIDITMKFIVILLTLVLGLCDGARRTTTASMSEARHIRHPQRQQENVWDLVELQKLDNHANVWDKNPPSANATDVQDSDVSNTRQAYPGLPSPGDTNELPGPITIKPIPVITPPPGCYTLRGQFPSQKSCANYLNCWDETVTEQTCPDGLLFNDVTLVCDYDYNVNCGARSLPTPKPSMPPGSKMCPEPNGRYRSATNCSEFYVCVYRKPIKFGCPRGLVYNDILGVCDYPYNVDCKGAATPSLPPQSTSPQTRPPQPPTLPPPSWPSQPPQQPSYGPSQPPQQPPWTSQPTQQPSWPSQPSYNPGEPSQPEQTRPPGYIYGGNPWLGKVQPDPWHERPVAAQLEIDKEQQQELFSEQQTPEPFQNPWNLVQSIPPSLTMVPCKDGDVHRLNDSCTNVVVCRNGRPQLLQCLSGYSYDRPTDSCKPFSIAKC